jgi:hypothetical protein
VAAERVEPREAYDDHVLVRCPACGQRATVHYRGDDLRLTCARCGHSDSIPKPRRHFEERPVPSLRAYNEGRPPFGASLWLETECCGGKRLWALNERHLDYIERFVRSSNRDAEFPSVAGHRQLADKFPAWLTTRKHRNEIIKAIQRLRSTL